MGSLQDAPFVQKLAENVSTTNDKAVKITYTSSANFLKHDVDSVHPEQV